MVFFTCNNCGESLKKPAVEKHYFRQCRNNPVNVSCMDCNKDFGDDFVKHTKCISEVEKYSGKNFVPRESKNSGAKKQESWMDIVHSIMESSEYQLSPDIRRAFQKLQALQNVPRKKSKFENYTKSCLQFTKPITAKVWEILEKELEKMKAAHAQSKEAVAGKREAETNGHDEPAKKKLKHDSDATNGNENTEQTEAIKKKSKKTKLNGNANVQENGGNEVAKKKSKKSNNNTNGAAVVQQDDAAIDADTTTTDDDAFDWSTVLEKLVQKHSDGILLEKLKGKVQKKYVKKLGSDDLTEKQQKKFAKKFAKHLKNCPQIQVDNDMVRSC